MIVQGATGQAAEAVQRCGINLSRLARETGIPYMNLYRSLTPSAGRNLNADEYLSLCAYLNLNPMELVSAAASTAAEQDAGANQKGV